MGDTELYDRLGVSKHASFSEIKREYHRLAKQYHPDKNPGNEDKFKDIQFAYEVLSDPQRRERYDHFGMSAVKDDGEGAGPSGFPFGESIFSTMFGGDPFGFGGGRRRRSKAESIAIPLEVTLEELYNGATKSVEFKRKELCASCHGSGGKSGSVTTCKKCKGSGIQTMYRQIGPGMVQQMQSQCDDCGGSGDFIREKDRCKKCKGKRLIERDHKLEVPISPGMRHEQRIPFRGEADQMYQGEAGDVIVVLQQMDHAVFRRSDLDLIIDKKISLREALCGFQFPLEHLDGRKLWVKSDDCDVLSPGCVRGLTNEGMPMFRHNEIRGNLYIRIDVDFPEDQFLTEENLKKLESLLPSRPDEPPISEDMEDVNMMEFEGTRGLGDDSHRGEAYDESDDEDGPGGHRVGCSQQ